MGTAVRNMEVATAGWWWYLTGRRDADEDRTSRLINVVAFVGLAVLVLAYVTHLVHIMQRVQKNREERQEKAQRVQRQRRKRLTTSAFYTSLMKDSQDSLASSQYDDFVQNPTHGDESTLLTENSNLTGMPRPVNKRTRQLITGMTRQKSFSLPTLSEA